MSSRRRLPAEGAVVALMFAYAVGCARSSIEVDTPDTSEGEAVLAALEHVAELSWTVSTTTTVKGRAAVGFRGEHPLSESTSAFLDEAFEARGWRWSSGNPVVPEGCTFILGDCRLRDPTELTLRFSVGAPGGEDAYTVYVRWLNSFQSRGRTRAAAGGYYLVVTPGTKGWVVEVRGRAV